MSSFVGQNDEDSFGFDTNIKQYVEAGLCWQSDNNGSMDSYCTLSSEACREGYSFVSAQQEHIKEYAGECISKTTTDTTRIGQCIDDFSGYSPCASVKELCLTPTSFIPSSEKCEVALDYTLDNPMKTKYGSCISAGDKTCFWSDGEWCEGGSLFIADDSCTCENVLVGACKNNDKDEIFCAVSETSCDNLSYWIQPRDLMETHFIKCHLCGDAKEMSQTIPAKTPSSTPIFERPPHLPPSGYAPSMGDQEPSIATPSEILDTPSVMDTDFMPAEFMPVSDDDQLQETGYVINHGSNKSGLIIGGIVGGLVLALISIIGLLLYVRKHNRQRDAAMTPAVIIESSSTEFGEQLSNEDNKKIRENLII
mmetsp:Transcript_34278/g.39023  ORF Transcript_34278/g.39023 Transcript_34278/m.39023 type:complete len:366 (-) Transcript_34278:40-1137(-)